MIRYRALDTNGDMTFGRGNLNFLIDSSDAVAQAIQTRLRLWTGEWFLDSTVGTPWMTQIIGRNTTKLYDRAIKDRVLGTRGVSQISDYSSTVIDRHLKAQMTVDTLFTGQIVLQAVFQYPPRPSSFPPPGPGGSNFGVLDWTIAGNPFVTIL